MVRSSSSNKNAKKGRGILSKGITAVKKVGSKIKHGAKVAKATGQLAGRLANPKNAVKMVKDAKKGKGLVLPGSNYIGPGNPMNRKVKSKGDALAKKHDEDYDEYLKAGVSKKKVYGGYSDADSRLRKASDTTTPEGVATYLGMTAKKGLAKLTGQKKLKDKDVKAMSAVKKKAQAKAKSMTTGGRGAGGAAVRTPPSIG